MVVVVGGGCWLLVVGRCLVVLSWLLWLSWLLFSGCGGGACCRFAAVAVCYT